MTRIVPYHLWTYLITTASPPGPPSPRPPSGSCRSSWTSPRLPCPRRSPCSPWLRTLVRTITNKQKGEEVVVVFDGVTVVWRCLGVKNGAALTRVSTVPRREKKTQSQRVSLLRSGTSSQVRPNPLALWRLVKLSPLAHAGNPRSSCVHSTRAVSSRARPPSSPPGQ